MNPLTVSGMSGHSSGPANQSSFGVVYATAPTRAPADMPCTTMLRRLTPVARAVPRTYCTAALMFCSGHGNTGPEPPAFEEVVIRQEDDVALGDEPIGPRSHTLEATADPAAAVHDQTATLR